MLQTSNTELDTRVIENFALTSERDDHQITQSVQASTPACEDEDGSKSNTGREHEEHV